MAEPPHGSRRVEPLRHVAWARDLAAGHRTHLSETVRAFVGADDVAPAGWDALVAAVHGDDAARFAEAVRDDGPAESADDFRYWRRGELRWATARVTRAAGRLDGLIVDVTDRVRTAEIVSADQRRAAALLALASRISAHVDLEDIARVVCVSALEAFGAHVRTAFLQFEAGTGAWVPVHHEGAPAQALALPPRFDIRDAGMPAYALEQRVRYAPDATVAPEAHIAASLGVRGFAVAYVILDGALLGALTLATFDRPLALEASDLDLLRGMADQAARAVSNARLLTESRLHAQRYRNILETVFDGINITGFDGVITYCNSQFAAMLGSTPDVVVGKTMHDLIFPEDSEVAAERIRRRRAGHTAPNQWRLRALDDGREVLVRANSREIKDEHGRPIAMLGVVSDITSARRMEEKLLQAQKLESLGVLAGGIAHDFNNLLAGILGNTGLARMDLEPVSPMGPLLDEIQAAALRAADLTRQLLSYSGKGRYVLSAIDLSAVIGNALRSLGTEVRAGIALRSDLAVGLPPIEGDSAQLGQVLSSLVANAADAIGDRGGVVTVATMTCSADDEFLTDSFADRQLARGEYVCLEVSDTGEGMSPETITRIFNPFYTTRFVGRGLGLAAVLGILRGHRGAIEVRSEPGRGTTMRTYFPAIGDAVANPGAGATTAAATRGAILVIDDEEGVRNVARRILERAGFPVIVACDGADGVARFRERAHEIAAVLLDVTMPRMSGQETFAELRCIRDDVRVLLTSGYSEPETMDRFDGHGRAEFIEKPFQPESLLLKLRAMLDR